ncbi:type I-E CRISPR-associated protein Cas6/Cse3/CasE [Pantoea sp. 1.19]|uniref:type I-E CRISPR-associated protein Cas6/Cse3/CasE n=1 Tax=Pantoea sp. 1.19 TaxID=1925589 RepID=UPI000948BDB8|nr:type I-E CRISPR-associated protein Cas6/Cse3/CasE [Pantoea sp. 1.19]
MFLSRVNVDWRWANDPYQLHRALWQLFPDRPQDKRDFLFRAEKGQASSGMQVLMQSACAPQSVKIASVLATKAVDLRLPSGTPLLFRLRANPIKTIKDKRARLNAKGQIKSCRVPLVGEEACIQWLLRKLGTAAALQSARITAEPTLLFNKKGVMGKIQTVLFEGELQIVDAEAFYLLLTQGIGPAKSLGCGLVSLARA